MKLQTDAHYSLCAGLAVLCKYWLQPERFDIVEEHEYNLTPALRREVRQIIFAHFDQIVEAWREHFGGDRGK